MIDKKNKAAILMGKLGGAARTEAKVAAAKANGVSGGRPHRVELSEDHKTALVEVLGKDHARLTRNRDDDPAWSDRLWQKSIDECVALSEKLSKPGALHVDLKKSELIHFIQLLAERIAVEERGASKSHSNGVLDAMLIRYHSVAEHLDSLLSPWSSQQPSLLAHYLKESRGRFA